MNNAGAAPVPRPGASSGLDITELCATFDTLLGDSADSAPGVQDEHIAALDAAHELLANALNSLSLDTSRQGHL